MIKQYDKVKITKLYRDFKKNDSAIGDGLPKVGDIATVVELFLHPHAAYELECTEEDGSSKWLITFGKDDGELEAI